MIQILLPLVYPSIVVAFIVGPSLSIKRWILNGPRERPVWRGVLVILGAVSSFVSAALYIATMIYARVYEGFPYGGLPVYDPTLRIYRYGLLTALLGFVLSFFGKRRFRFAMLILSFALLFLWFGFGMAD
jgi:hypothetical protein